MSQPQQTPSPYFFLYPNPTPAPVNGQFQAQPPFQLHPFAVPQNGAVPLHNHPTFPPAVDSFIGTSLEPGNVVPAAFWCEVCNVVCNGKDAFQAQGKKHRKNLQRKIFSSRVSIQNATVEQMILGATAATFSEELEKKKQALLKNGAVVGSILLCTIKRFFKNVEIELAVEFGHSIETFRLSFRFLGYLALAF